uniref:Uncharacterized protein n=1 Tax=Plectus sambesii TaxID=2011161 RepID=A0A914XJV2_9BILA
MSGQCKDTSSIRSREKLFLVAAEAAGSIPSGGAINRPRANSAEMDHPLSAASAPSSDRLFRALSTDCCAQSKEALGFLKRAKNVDPLAPNITAVQQHDKNAADESRRHLTDFLLVKKTNPHDNAELILRRRA